MSGWRRCMQLPVGLQSCCNNLFFFSLFLFSHGSMLQTQLRSYPCSAGRYLAKPQRPQRWSGARLSGVSCQCSASAPRARLLGPTMHYLFSVDASWSWSRLGSHCHLSCSLARHVTSSTCTHSPLLQLATVPRSV